MRLIKRIVVVALLGIVVLLSVAVSTWLLVGDETLVSALERRIEADSGVRLSHLGAARITRTLTPEIAIQQLVVDGPTGSYRIEVSSLHLRISLAKLLVWQLDIPALRIGDVRITILRRTSAATMPDLAPLRFTPVLHHLEIGKVSLVRDGQETHLPKIALDEIAIRLDPESDAVHISAQLGVARESIAVEASLPDLRNALRRQSLGFAVTARCEQVTLSGDGSLAFGKTKPAVDAALRISAPDLSKLVFPVKGLVVPGALTATARLSGTLDRLALSKFTAYWQGPGETVMTLAGEIDNVVQLDGIQLELSATLDNPLWLEPALPKGVAISGRADLHTRISGAYKQLGVRDFNLKSKNTTGLAIALNGQFDAVPASPAMRMENIDLRMAFSAPSTQAARALLFEAAPELGAIAGSAHLRSGLGAPALEAVAITTRDSAGIDVDLTGRIARFPLDPAESNDGYDLAVTMRADSASTLAARAGLKLPLSGPSTLSFRIEGQTQALALTRIKLSAGEKKAVQIGAQGQLQFGRWDRHPPLQSLDLAIQINSNDTNALTPLIGRRLVELGAIDATGRLHTLSGKHRLDALRIRNRPGSRLNVSLSGAIGDITFAPRLAAQGLQIKAEATARDAAQLNAVFGLKDKIPAIGPCKASAAITGSDQELLVTDVSVTAGSKSVLLVTAAGRLGRLSAKNDWRLRNLDLRINANSTGSRAFVKLLGHQLPELGPIRAEAKIADKNQKPGIESASIRVGNAASPAVSATGFVDDLLGAARMRWDVKLNIDGHTLAAFADKQKLPDLGPLVGSLAIANTDGTLGFDALDIGTTQSALLNLVVKGRFDDFEKPETLSLDASLTARDLQLVGAMIDRDWPTLGPVRIACKITRADAGAEFDTTVSLGDIQAKAALKGTFDAGHPHFSGRITAQDLVLPDLLQGAVDTAKKGKKTKAPIFSVTPLDLSLLKKTDLDLAVDIASFNKQKSGLKSAQLVVALKDGLLSIDPATFEYPHGKLDLDFQVDSRQAPPRIRFKAYGKNLDPWQTLDIQQGQKTHDAHMDVDVVVTSSGNSPHELAANADGSVYVTSRDGKIRRWLVDLVFVDLVGWTVGQTTRDAYYDIDCGVADYGIKKGVLTTKAFLLDSKNIAVSGKGDIDLGRETVDYVLLPRKKSRIIFKADPVKITGALNDPSVSLIPWKSAAATYGELVFAPYIFVGLTAADIVSNALGIGPKSSPCLEYEKRYKSGSGTPGK